MPVSDFYLWGNDKMEKETGRKLWQINWDRKKRSMKPIRH